MDAMRSKICKKQRTLQNTPSAGWKQVNRLWSNYRTIGFFVRYNNWNFKKPFFIFGPNCSVIFLSVKRQGNRWIASRKYDAEQRSWMRWKFFNTVRCVLSTVWWFFSISHYSDSYSLPHQIHQRHLVRRSRLKYLLNNTRRDVRKEK